MNEPLSPTTLLGGALLLGSGLYLIQRSRFLLLALMRRIPALRTRARAARGLLLVLLTLGVLLGGMGCRILLQWALALGG